MIDNVFFFKFVLLDYLLVLTCITVNGICLFRQLNNFLGVGNTPSNTMKFLPDVGVYEEARNQKNLLT